MTDPSNVYGPGHTHHEYQTALQTGYENGSWDDHGRPAPWPDNIDEWSPETTKINNPNPDQPF